MCIRDSSRPESTATRHRSFAVCGRSVLPVAVRSHSLSRIRLLYTSRCV
nr:hypothetical protein [Pseudomonas sp. HS-2]